MIILLQITIDDVGNPFLGTQCGLIFTCDSSYCCSAY